MEHGMAITSPRGTRWTVTALLGLTVVTGLVDAVSYLRLGRVFVANMTGNVVFLGFSVDPHSGLSPVASLIAIGGFLVGASIGGRMAARLSGRPHRWLASSIGTEAAVLAIVAILAATGTFPFSGRGDYVTIVVLAVALGLQNSTVRHFAVPDMTTTVLSLTLTGLAADNALLGGSGSRPHRRLGSVAAMLAGATIGAGLLQVSPSGVIGLAATLAAGAAIVFGTGRIGEQTNTNGPPEGAARSLP
jgi:uncharacterized membrane protein YoaK (UPF0700 family)